MMPYFDEWTFHRSPTFCASTIDLETVSVAIDEWSGWRHRRHLVSLINRQGQPAAYAIHDVAHRRPASRPLHDDGSGLELRSWRACQKSPRVFHKVARIAVVRCPEITDDD